MFTCTVDPHSQTERSTQTPVIFMSTRQLVCMSKYSRLVATLHRRRNPHASPLSHSLYLLCIN